MVVVTPLAGATALVPGNIVVAIGFSDQSTTKFGEFTPSGAMVQSYSITTPVGTQNVVSGITVGAGGQPYVYAGNFNPQLWTINPATGLQSTTTATAWSNVGSTASGGLTAYQKYVFATSEKAANSNGGVFRFDLTNGSAQQWFNPNPITVSGNTSYDKIKVGFDNRLYALFNNGGYSSPYLVSADPDTGAGFAVSTLFESVNDVAVDAAGNLYVIRGNTSAIGEAIDELSPSHTLLRTLAFPDGTLKGVPNTIELSPTGNILVSSNQGTILQTTTAFGAYTTFNTGPTLGIGKTVEYTASAFVQTPVPEPGSLTIAVGGGMFLLARRSRQPALQAV